MFKIFKNKRHDPILIYFFILNVLGFSQNIFKNRFYDNGWTVGEWLISYSGGFVRRGLIGSIIFQISEATKLNPILLVQIISAFSFIVFLFFLLKCNKTFSSLFLFSPIVSLAPSLGNFIIRKDIFGIISFAFCLYLIIKFQNQKSFIFVNVASMIAILNHESYFFYGIPSLIFIRYTILKAKKIQNISLISTIRFFIPSLLIFLLVFYFKGDWYIANIIHESWQSLSSIIPTQGKLFNKDSFDAINQIGWDKNDILYLLKNSFFGDDSFIGNGFIYIPAIWLLTIFITGQIFVGDNDRYFGKLKANVLLMQFSAISPLFFLGVDYGRWIFLWVSSSIFLTTSLIYIYEEFDYSINIVPNFYLRYLNGFVLTKRWKYLYLFITIPPCCWTLKSFFYKIPGFLPFTVLLEYKKSILDLIN